MDPFSGSHREGTEEDSYGIVGIVRQLAEAQTTGVHPPMPVQTLGKTQAAPVQAVMLPASPQPFVKQQSPVPVSAIAQLAASANPATAATTCTHANALLFIFMIDLSSFFAETRKRIVADCS